jgi:hypothetical protein
MSNLFGKLKEVTEQVVTKAEDVVTNVGSKFGNIVDTTGQHISNFTMSSISKFTAKKNEKKDDKKKDDKKKEKKAEPAPAVAAPAPEVAAPAQTAQTAPEMAAPAPASVPVAPPAVQNFSAVGEKGWAAGAWAIERKKTWHGNVDEDVQVPNGPVSYQQAILTQPMPVLSPLRGTNSPQGIRAIVDASSGTTTTSYDPNLPPLPVAIPTNASAGSLDASVKVNVAAVNNGATSSFAAMFG